MPRFSLYSEFRAGRLTLDKQAFERAVAFWPDSLRAELTKVIQGQFPDGRYSSISIA